MLLLLLLLATKRREDGARERTVLSSRNGHASDHVVAAVSYEEDAKHAAGVFSFFSRVVSGGSCRNPAACWQRALHWILHWIRSPRQAARRVEGCVGAIAVSRPRPAATAGKVLHGPRLGVNEEHHVVMAVGAEKQAVRPAHQRVERVLDRRRRRRQRRW
jgi:hypothetical protein